jgi:hypothetical protein
MAEVSLRVVMVEPRTYTYYFMTFSVTSSTPAPSSTVNVQGE